MRVAREEVHLHSPNRAQVAAHTQEHFRTKRCCECENGSNSSRSRSASFEASVRPLQPETRNCRSAHNGSASLFSVQAEKFCSVKSAGKRACFRHVLQLTRHGRRIDAATDGASSISGYN